MQVIKLLSSVQLKSFTSWRLFQSARLSWYEKRESEKTLPLSQRSWSSTGNRMTQSKVWALDEFGASTFINQSLHYTYLSPSPHRITGQEFPWPETIPSFLSLCSTQLAKGRQQNKNKPLSTKKERERTLQQCWIAQEPHVNKVPSWPPLNTPNRLKHFFHYLRAALA